MKSKNVIVSMMVCFLLAMTAFSVVSANRMDMSKAETGKELTRGIAIYVDDDYDRTTPAWGSYRFDNIQDGIDAAVEGEAVGVFNGNYGSVEIDKTLTLFAVHGTTPTIDGPLEISADGVTVDGFTIESLNGPGINIGASGCTIINNNIQLSSDGLYISGSNNKVYHNNFIGINMGRCVRIVSGTGNIFDDGFIGGGNYWDDPIAMVLNDDFHGESQDILGSDGIFDTANCYGDNFPSTEQNGWERCDADGNMCVNPMDIGFALNRRVDVNGDGLVDGTDISVIIEHIGMIL